MKKLIALLLTLLLLAGLAACAKPAAEQPAPAEQTTTTEQTATTEQAPADETPTEEKKTVKLGLANINEKATFGKLVKMGFEDACAARGWELVYVDNNSDGAQAVQNAEILVQQGVDFIVDLNIDQSVAGTIVDIVSAANIPMVCVDIAMGDTPFFGVDSDKVGRMAGEYSVNWVNENWGGEVDYIVCFTAIASGDEVQKRARSAVEVMQNSGIKIGDTVEIEYQNDTAVAQQRFADFLTAHPDAHKIVCYGINEFAGTGAIAAGETAGRTDDFALFTCGVGSQFVEPLYEAQGNSPWKTAVAAFPELYGDQLCDIIENYFNGVPLEPLMPCKLVCVDWSNITEYYPLDDLPWKRLS